MAEGGDEVRMVPGGCLMSPSPRGSRRSRWVWVSLSESIFCRFLWRQTDYRTIRRRNSMFQFWEDPQGLDSL